MSLATRQATPADLVFVVHSWARSYRDSHKAGLEQVADFMQTQPPILRKILSRPGARVLVAYEQAATSTKADIYGWLAYERGFEIPRQGVMEQPDCPLVHYFYVKQPYRRLGVWAQLMKAAGIALDRHMYLTCETSVLLDLPLPRTTFNSNIARNPWRRNDSSKEETSTETITTSSRARKRHTPGRKAR